MVADWYQTIKINNFILFCDNIHFNQFQNELVKKPRGGRKSPHNFRSNSSPVRGNMITNTNIDYRTRILIFKVFFFKQYFCFHFSIYSTLFILFYFTSTNTLVNC